VAPVLYRTLELPPLGALLLYIALLSRKVSHSKTSDFNLNFDFGFFDQESPLNIQRA
jgi:hypothetical protein